MNQTLLNVCIQKKKTLLNVNQKKLVRHTPFANGEVKSSDDFNWTIILITLLRRGSQVKR